MQEIGMADSGTITNRDFSSQIDEDDPLMELSRIIGLEPRRESVSRYAPRPEARIDPDFDAPVDAEALVGPASPEISDVLQQDLAEDLIASLESEDDFSDLDADENAAAPLQTLEGQEEGHEDGIAEAETLSAEFAGGPVPHIEMSSPASGPIPGSLEDELEAMLNPEASRHVPFGMRPADDEPDALADDEDGDFEDVPASAQLTPEPVMAFDEELEPAAASADADYEEQTPEQEMLEQVSDSEPVNPEPSDYWSRAARRSENIPAYAPDAVAAAEEYYPDEELVEAPLAAAAAAKPSALKSRSCSNSAIASLIWS
jgi:hypothetical protein